MRRTRLRRSVGLKRGKPILAKGRRGKVNDRLHALWRECLILWDGEKCQAEGMWGIRCGGPLQGHHIYGKGPYPAMRYDLENGVVLCRNHHLFGIESQPAPEVLPWLVRVVGQERLQWLHERSVATKGTRHAKGYLLDVEAFLEASRDALVRGPFAGAGDVESDTPGRDA